MVPENIDKKLKYDLSAILFVDRFFYGIHYNAKVIFDEVLSYKDNLDLSRQIKRAGLDELNLEKTSIVSHLPPAGLIDYDNFEFKDFKSYFKDKYPDEHLNISEYFSSKLVGQKLFSTFAIKKSLKNTLVKAFPNVEFFHVSKILSDYLIKKKSDSVLMLLSQTSLSVVSIEDGKTVFSNVFRLTGELDASYYIKSLYKTMSYDQNKPCYIINSKANKNDLDSFQDYFSNCSVVPKSNLELIEALACVS